MKVNGCDTTYVENETVLALLLREEYDASKVVVELNGTIIKKDDFTTTLIKPADTVEVISFVGGG